MIFSSHKPTLTPLGKYPALGVSALMVVSVINRFYPTWIINSGWQTFLLNAGHLILCGLLLCTAPIRSPRLWKILGALSIILYLIICIGLVIGPRLAGHHHHGPKHLAKMLVTFHNDTTFKSKGAAVDAFVFLMGTSLVSLAFGAEASAHLAEETRTPAATVPKALFSSTLVSYILGLILNICLVAVSLSVTI
jgi:amino acid transporter